MIRNVVFDMGNVLIRYDPIHFVERTGIGRPEDRKALLEAIFFSPEWPRMDRGDLDEPELEVIVRRRLPARLHGVAHKLIFSWEKPMEPIPGMADFARDCKKAGLGVYLLSNASRRQPEYWSDIPGSECFDGAVISALLRLTKPDAAIYRALLAQYHLNAAECLFIDDMPVNVAGAIDAGMQGIVFDGDVAALRRAVFGGEP